MGHYRAQKAPASLPCGVGASDAPPLVPVLLGDAGESRGLMRSFIKKSVYESYSLHRAVK